MKQPYFLRSFQIIICLVTALTAQAAADMFVYIGTYTGAKSKGIYLSRLNLEQGTLAEPTLAAETPSPSFVAIHPNGKFLYAVGEVGQFEGKKTGAVSAFAIDHSTGKLKALNAKSSGGTGPCHLSVDKTGKVVLVANYGGGSVASLPINEDGSLGDPASVIQHEGASVNKQRQEAPHAHSINLDPANRLVFAADLGLDKILVYTLDPGTAKLRPHEPPFAATKPGGGPRHFAFHPNGKFAYSNLEMTSEVTAFAYDSAAGTLQGIQVISTLPQGASVPNNSTAEIQVHPSGKFVYCSNRGHDSVAVFAIEPQSGKLKYIENEPTQGKTPRNFAIDPTGKYLLAENQGSDSIVVFRIDSATGELEPVGSKISVPSPVCVKFLPVR